MKPPSQAGTSAEREYERRPGNREERVREKYPRIGGALLAISGAKFPLLNIRGFELKGIRIGNLDNMNGVLRADGELTDSTRRAIFDQLAVRLPPSS